MRQSLSRRTDYILDGVKWPVASFFLAGLPLLLWGNARLVYSILTFTAPWNSSTFALGVVLFVLAWRSLVGKTTWGQWLIHLEHEFTHMIFAAATAHPIVGFRASVAGGSEVRFLGKGNWLITSAPYFFPTAAIVLWLPSLFLPLSTLIWTNLALGMATGYHIVSTIRETHRDQVDLQQLSWRFCWMFLPAANLLVLGCLVSFSQAGLSGIQTFFIYSQEPIAYLLSFFG